MSQVGLVLATIVALGVTAPSASALPSQGSASKGSVERSVDVSGSLDIPGVGTVNLGQGRNKPPSVDGRYDRRPAPPPVDDGREQRIYADKAFEAIRDLAEEPGEQSGNTFSRYEKARRSLTTIRVVADIFSSDRVFRSISRTASETLAATREDWGPFDAEKVYGALKTIRQLTQ